MNRKVFTLLLAFFLSAAVIQAETEFKLVLTAQGYRAIQSSLAEIQTAPSKGVTQTNYYIDTQRLDLRKMGVSFRLRMKGPVASISVKVGGAPTSDPAEAGKDLVSKMEYQCRFSDGLETAEKIVGGRMDLLYALNNDSAPTSDSEAPHPLDFLRNKVFNRTVAAGDARGTLKWSQIATRATNSTFRQAFKLSVAGVERKVELDETRFPAGYVGYEFEMELPEDTSAEEQELVREAIHGLFLKLGIAYKASIEGKASTTFIILSNDRKEIGRLVNHGQIRRGPGGTP